MIRRRWFQFMGMLMLLSVGLSFYGVKEAGAIEFYAARTYDAGTNSWSVFASDLDGDGDADIAVANWGLIHLS